jgi:cephalosporin hydroxylase
MNEYKKKFHEERKQNVYEMNHNKRLKRVSKEWMIESAKTKYSYNFDWLGRPIIQYPQDIIVMQEIIWKVKPDLIIETGIAHGGSIIFYASIL